MCPVGCNGHGLCVVWRGSMEDYGQSVYISVQHGYIQGAQRPALQEVIPLEYTYGECRSFITTGVHTGRCIVFPLHREG